LKGVSFWGIPTWFGGESVVTLIVSQVLIGICNAGTIRHEIKDWANGDTIDDRPILISSVNPIPLAQVAELPPENRQNPHHD